jgi:hypothetical protein
MLVSTVRSLHRADVGSVADISSLGGTQDALWLASPPTRVVPVSSPVWAPTGLWFTADSCDFSPFWLLLSQKKKPDLRGTDRGGRPGASTNYKWNSQILLRQLLVKNHEKLVCIFSCYRERPPLWPTGQSYWLQIQRSWVRFPALPIILRSSGSGTGSTRPREDNWGDTWKKK